MTSYSTTVVAIDPKIFRKVSDRLFIDYRAWPEAKSSLCVVLFHSPHCGACTALQPKFESISQQFTTSYNSQYVVFAQCNLAKLGGDSLVSASNNTITPLRFVPTIVVFKDGYALKIIPNEYVFNFSRFKSAVEEVGINNAGDGAPNSRAFYDSTLGITIRTISLDGAISDIPDGTASAYTQPTVSVTSDTQWPGLFRANAAFMSNEAMNNSEYLKPQFDGARAGIYKIL